MPKVDVILVKYNQPELEAATIRSVLETAGPVSYGLVAHQNAPGVGLAACWNRLIANSTAEYVCLLNTDVVPAHGWLSRLCKELDDHPEWAAVVPSSNRVHLSQVDVTSPVYNVHHATFVQGQLPPGVQLLPTCSAMCVVFRRSAWSKAVHSHHSQFETEQPRGFDEDFQFYGEDTEFFYRVRAMGLGDIAWVRDVYVHHIGQQSFRKAYDTNQYVALRARAAELWEKKKGEIDACYPERAMPV